MPDAQVREDPSLIDAKQHLLRVDPICQLLETRMLRFASLQPTKGSFTGLFHIRIGRRILHTLIKRHGNVRTQVPLNLYQTDQWAAKLFNVKGRYNDPSLKGAWRSAIIAICDAAERFSETKTGALIVLERHTNLSEIVRTGTPVNSAVNLEVLGTIFYEGTPLHDGAAIIENGRIKAAGCVLPLSNNLDLGKDMGTRHRACLGIAENSDAIAIVVSEETGIISMAKNGVLIRHFDRQTLYTRLVDEMIPKETTTEKTTVSGWRGQLDRLWKWVSQKEDDAQ